MWDGLMEQGKRPWLKFKILKWVLTCSGLILSISVAINYYHNEKKRFLSNLDLKAERAIAKIESNLQIYETLITQTQAFFITIQKVNSLNFNSYYRNLRDISRFYGIQGLGFTRYIKREDLPQFLSEARKEQPHFELWPFTEKEEYYPVLYLQPLDKAIGFDQGSEKKREHAFKVAMMTKDTTMSGKINFVQERDLIYTSPGFLFLRPVYFDQEKKNLTGFIFAPFLYKDFFENIWQDFNDSFYFRVYDGTSADLESLVYSNKEGNKNEDLSIKKNIHIYGEKLHIIFYPKNLSSRLMEVAYLIFLFGLSCTLIVLKILNDTIKKAELVSINENYLKESLRARDEFISLASHELKTPLTSLKMRAQLSIRKIKEGPIDSKTIKDFANEIVKQVDRLERLVNDILDFSRIRTGNLSLQPEKLNFSHFIEEIISRMSAQFSEKTFPLLIKPKTDIYVCWDKIRIEQVITNLLTNAIKYGENTPIEVELKDVGKEVLISVKDKGRGIAPEFKDAIFNRFERAGISPNEISGLGLGLYITYQIVSSHQGKIWVESDLGQGSIFYVKLPKDPKF